MKRLINDFLVVMCGLAIGYALDCNISNYIDIRYIDVCGCIYGFSVMLMLYGCEFLRNHCSMVE